MLGSEYEYLMGVLTIFSGPQAGCSIVVTMLRASTGENARHHKLANLLLFLEKKSD